MALFGDRLVAKIEDRGTPSPGSGVLPALEGVGLILWNIIATPLIGKRRLRWGTIDSEWTDPLAGDELVPDPKWSYTLGVGIEAPPAAVWPWIAQLGQARGGFYTYEALENLAGCRVSNTTEILPAFQDPQVGDGIYLHPTTPPLGIEIVDAPHALVLLGAPVEGTAHKWGMSTWQFIVKSDGAGGSRFLTRGRYDYSPDWQSRVMFGRFPLEVISFVMSRKMMLEIKRLAEATL